MGKLLDKWNQTQHTQRIGAVYDIVVTFGITFGVSHEVLRVAQTALHIILPGEVPLP